MNRTAILSDIHGNPLALEAVLIDIEQNVGADSFYVLGDIAAIGYDPVQPLEMITALPGLKAVRGNTERFLVTGERPLPSPAEMAKQPERLPDYMHLIAGFAWTQGIITHNGWMSWLAELPLEIRATLPDGTRFLGVHASPGKDDGDGINPLTSEEKLNKMANIAQADLICVGHTHWPLEKQLNGVHFFNIGSVGNPLIPDGKACYAVLETGKDGYQISHRYVEYDHETVIKAVRAADHPMADYIIRFQHGKNKPPWA